MKTIASNEGFTEIHGPGLREISGGAAGLGVAILGAIVGAVVVSIIDDWDNCKNGIR